MAWKLNRKALRRQRAEQAALKNKPAEKDLVTPSASEVGSQPTPRDFPAGNVADIKRTSLFLHDDRGKATAAWWKNTKGRKAA